MAVNRGLFVRNVGTVGTTPAEARLVLAELVAENAPGVPRQGLLGQSATQVVTGTAATAPMSYSVAACTAVINRAANEGVYIVNLTGTETVTTTAAPASGSRYDLIYVKQNDPDKGDTGNAAVVAVYQGTPSAGTPTKPYANLPSGAYVLAEVLIQAGATSTNSAQVTITQVWTYTALRGAPVPLRTQTERDAITSPHVGMEVLRLDVYGAIETWTGTVWRRAEYMATVTTSDTNWTYNGGLYVSTPPGGRTRVNMLVKLTRTGSAINLSTTPVQAFAALIPPSLRPDGYSVTSYSVIQTSGGTDRWGSYTRITAAGDMFLRTDSGTTTLQTGDHLVLDISWLAA